LSLSVGDQGGIDRLVSVDLLAIRALAKLSIIFPPAAVHSSASLLQRFEAVMALTNISSATPEAAERETLVGDIVKRAETHLLDSNTMLRRASTELICNLVGSFDYFGAPRTPAPKLDPRCTVGCRRSSNQIGCIWCPGHPP
ncbi:hypothetical protein JB92DRAFT_3007445, partial [Gautieria morchelliformis]